MLGDAERRLGESSRRNHDSDVSTDISFQSGKSFHSFNIGFSSPLFALNDNQYVFPAKIAPDTNIYLATPPSNLAYGSFTGSHDAATSVKSLLKTSNYRLELFP